MDPNKETPLLTNTGGQPGIDHPSHAKQLKTEVARNAGVQPAEVVPGAENIIGNAEKASFLEDVAHIPAELDKTAEINNQNPALNISKFGETLNALSPVGDENDRTVASEVIKQVQEEKGA